MIKTMTSGTLLKSPAAIPNTRKSTTINNKGLTANHPRRAEPELHRGLLPIAERVSVFSRGAGEKNLMMMI